MKRIILLSLTVLLCLPLSVYAASIGGAETQGQGRFSIGLDSTFVFDKDLEFKSFKSAPGLGANQTIKNIEVDKAYEVMLKTSCGLLDNLDVYINLGVVDNKLKDEFYVGGTKYADDKVNTGTDFTYGFGLKGTYGLGNNWLVGCDLQYSRSKHKAKVTETTVAGATDSTTYKSTVFQGWHIAPYIAKKINDFTPYFGLRYSDMRLKMKEPSASGWSDDHKWKAEDNFGVFLGTDYKINDNLVLNLEGRFIDETAMSFAISYKF